MRMASGLAGEARQESHLRVSGRGPLVGRDSQSFGGIAVIGDTWAVSLDSDGSGGTSKAESRAPAAKITESFWLQEDAAAAMSAVPPSAMG